MAQAIYKRNFSLDPETVRVIGVMGMTGTGKSTFIKLLTGDKRIVVGEGLQSETFKVDVYKTKFKASDGKEYDVLIADTPGFNDTTRTDTDVLISIVAWLEKTRKAKCMLSGIIYLHPITQDRIGGSSAHNLAMMYDLVGESNMANVVMVTTRWEEIQEYASPTKVAEEMRKMELREKHLKEPFEAHNRNGQLELRKGFWADYLQAGATYVRHSNNPETARKILDTIVRTAPSFIQVQNEMASGKTLVETAAGQSVKTALDRVVVKNTERLKQLEEEMQVNEQKSQARLETQRQAYIELIQKMEADQNAMRDLYYAEKGPLRKALERLLDFFSII